MVFACLSYRVLTSFTLGPLTILVSSHHPGYVRLVPYDVTESIFLKLFLPLLLLTQSSPSCFCKCSFPLPCSMFLHNLQGSVVLYAVINWLGILVPLPSHEECNVPNHSWCDQREWDNPTRSRLETVMPCGCSAPREGFLFLVQEWETSQALRSACCNKEWPWTPTSDQQPRDNWPPFYWLWDLPVCGFLPRGAHPWSQRWGEHFFRNRWVFPISFS